MPGSIQATTGPAPRLTVRRRISKVGNATLRSSLYMPALSAMRYNPAIVALVVRLKNAGRLEAQANRRGGDAQATG